jgi:hypothetical protein
MRLPVLFLKSAGLHFSFSHKQLLSHMEWHLDVLSNDIQGTVIVCSFVVRIFAYPPFYFNVMRFNILPKVTVVAAVHALWVACSFPDSPDHFDSFMSLPAQCSFNAFPILHASDIHVVIFRNKTPTYDKPTILLMYTVAQQIACFVLGVTLFMTGKLCIRFLAKAKHFGPDQVCRLLGFHLLMKGFNCIVLNP